MDNNFACSTLACSRVHLLPYPPKQADRRNSHKHGYYSAASPRYWQDLPEKSTRREDHLFHHCHLQSSASEEQAGPDKIKTAVVPSLQGHYTPISHRADSHKENPMNFAISDEVVKDLEQFTVFLRTQMEPFLAEWYKREAVPREFFQDLGKDGWLGFTLKNGKFAEQSYTDGPP
jgi:hypothetical protein